MREINKLTVLKLAALNAPGRYADGLGLYLEIRRECSKSWAFRYMREGRARELGLGPLHSVNLAEARNRAREARQLLLDGKDPIDVKHEARTAAKIEAARAINFRQCAADYIAAHERSWKNSKHRAQWQATLEAYAFPLIGDFPVAEIDTALVLKVLQPIWQEKPETASRVRGRIESIFSYWCATQKVSRDNPARWNGNLKHLLPAKTKVRSVRHHSAIPFGKIPDFMAELRERDSLSARALEFTILTAARTGETTGATWDEIDLKAKVWTCPGERTKSGRDHRVPLSDRAVAILTSLPRDSVNVFPLSNWAMLELLKGMKGNGLTVHGFRSAFRDWAGERTNYPRDVIELALAHALKDKTEAAYRRGDALDKRRRLMAEWARYCAEPAVEATVTPIRGSQ